MPLGTESDIWQILSLLKICPLAEESMEVIADQQGFHTNARPPSSWIVKLWYLETKSYLSVEYKKHHYFDLKLASILYISVHQALSLLKIVYRVWSCPHTLGVRHRQIQSARILLLLILEAVSFSPWVTLSQSRLSKLIMTSDLHFGR